VFVDGIYVPEPESTFTIRAAVQPAREISRVIAGRDLIEKEQNGQVFDVRLMHTNTKLVGEVGIDTRNPTQDPDKVVYEGSDWTVLRCEPWNYRTYGATNDKFWQVILTREMGGAS
jgi:hypothetical protein